MLAVVQQAGDGYTARFERAFNHSVQQVWAYLTDNELLSTWFSELRVGELREGGSMKFHMPGGGDVLEMPILEMKLQSVLEYTWGEDVVRFELYPEVAGCKLVLIEKLSKLIDHTPRDLAGWHVCLEVIGALLDGRTIESRKDQWKHWFERYQEALAGLRG
ncbi:SRPBCC family protein [Paenibacillus albus]|uniref:SRPBCC family protein n=1 Tax=Paenibacillus albus TaxID=2495582 RepID=A0A3S8ZZ89_9BACL|nr:SRPBCC family protein [Paenibacillus albus]AZN38745.1 SRPBCC family protein [Paenibacillus albus]